MVEVAEGKPRAQPLDRLRRQRHAVAPRQRQQRLRQDRAFEMDVQVRLGRRTQVLHHRHHAYLLCWRQSHAAFEQSTPVWSFACPYTLANSCSYSVATAGLSMISTLSSFASFAVCVKLNDPVITVLSSITITLWCMVYLLPSSFAET